MKRILLTTLLVLSLFSLKAQRSFSELAFTGSKYEGGAAFGGLIQFEHENKVHANIGLNGQLLWFKGLRNPYIPLSGMIGYNIHASKTSIGFNANLGYGFFNYSDRYSTIKGGLYFAPGITFRSISQTSPYIAIRYSMYSFSNSDTYSNVYSSNVNAITFAFGIAVTNSKRK